MVARNGKRPQPDMPDALRAESLLSHNFTPQVALVGLVCRLVMFSLFCIPAFYEGQLSIAHEWRPMAET